MNAQLVSILGRHQEQVYVVESLYKLGIVAGLVMRLNSVWLVIAYH